MAFLSTLFCNDAHEALMFHQLIKSQSDVYRSVPFGGHNGMCVWRPVYPGGIKGLESETSFHPFAIFGQPPPPSTSFKQRAQSARQVCLIFALRRKESDMFVLYIRVAEGLFVGIELHNAAATGAVSSEESMDKFWCQERRHFGFSWDHFQA